MPAAAQDWTPCSSRRRSPANEHGLVNCELSFAELPLDDQEAMKRCIDAVLRCRKERLQSVKDSKKPDTLLSCCGKRGKKARKGQADWAKESQLPVSKDMDRDVRKLSKRCACIMRFILDAG